MTPITVELNPGSGGAKSLHDSALGTLNGGTPPTDAVAQIVEMAGRSAAFWPGYDAPSDSGVRTVNVDDGGALVTRGAVLTDEGTFRLNCANTSLAVSLGAVTVSGAVVTGTGFADADCHYKDYFKLSADADTAWVQIDTIDSDTQITLVSSYVGGSSGTGQRAVMKPVVGAGGSVSVASGQATIAAGTTATSVTGLLRFVDYAPLVSRNRLSVSQRIANQATLIGLREDASPPRWFARFRLEGTTNTTLVCETGRNPTGAPSASETESNTVTLPFGLTSAALLDYRVELLTEAVRFFVNGQRVAEHVRVLPHQHDEMASVVEVVNGTTPASGTSVVVDYVTGKNHNKLEVGIMSDSEQIIAVAQQLVPFAYSVAGVIAINTDLIVLDCRQIRALLIQCNAMGTTGVVTVQWSNEPTFAQPITATLLTEAGAIGTTFNAAGLRYTNVLAAYCRLRLTTATTAGTTTLNVWGSQNPIPLLVGTQPISGTVTANIGTGSLAAGTNLFGDVGIQARANATGAATIGPVSSLGATAATSIKATAGRVLGFYLHNKSASLRCVKLFNVVVGSVTMGTTAAVYELPIPAGGTVQVEIAAGLGHSAAIVYAVTAAVGLTNNDGTGLAAGDVVGVIAYA